jgi:hypothetical protein
MSDNTQLDYSAQVMDPNTGTRYGVAVVLLLCHKVLQQCACGVTMVMLRYTCTYECQHTTGLQCTNDGSLLHCPTIIKIL